MLSVRLQSRAYAFKKTSLEYGILKKIIIGTYMWAQKWPIKNLLGLSNKKVLLKNMLSKRLKIYFPAKKEEGQEGHQ